MRSIWRGSIAFGLVNVPVKMYGATRSHDLSLHQVHDRDGGRIRYQRRCEVCEEIVDYEHIDKAYEESGQTVILTDDDMAALPEAQGGEIEVVEFVPSDQIDPFRFERSYFLEPASESLKSYVLLRRTLQETERTAIVSFAVRQKTRLGALRARGDVLTLQGLRWDDELREPGFDVPGSKTRIQAKELKMSAALVESMSEDFEISRYTDEYQEQLRTLVEAKLEEGESLDTEATFGEPAETDDDNVVNLMEALRASVEKTRKSKKSGRAGGSKRRASS